MPELSSDVLGSLYRIPDPANAEHNRYCLAKKAETPWIKSEQNCWCNVRYRHQQFTKKQEGYNFHEDGSLQGLWVRYL